MRRSLQVVCGAVILIGLMGCGHSRKNAEPLLCYVGGTMRPVIEELAERYKAETGQQVDIDYADSGELLIKIEQTHKGDLYVCHDPFLAAAELKGLVRESWVLATLNPVIVVQKGNPQKISGLRDLARPGLRVVLTHQEYSTTGHLVSRMTDKAGIDLGSNVVSRTRGGGAAANAVMLGTADAAVVWDAVAYLRRDKLDSVPIEPEVKLKRGVDAVTTATFKRIEMDYIRVTMASLSVSSQPEAARRFGDFVASEKNADVWKKFGFSAPDRARDREGKKGESILVQCAAGMRLPVREMASEFERKHGVKVELAYDGSNRLLGSIKLTRKGDVYIAGDADYIDMAGKAGLVDESAAVCRFEPVIMVRKGNPKKISTLADMAKAGLKIGQADEQATAIGRLMPKLLGLNGVDRKLWKKNIVLTTTTVNELAMAIKLGTVDAVVVWHAVAAKYADDSEIVKIAENITPTVGAAVLSCGKNRQDGAAFLKFMQSKRGRDIMKRNGYLPVD